MKIKNRLIIIIFITTFFSILFSVSISVLLQNYEKSFRKTELANSIVLKVFERRILGDEYITSHLERSKIQWLAKQKETEDTISSHLYDYNNAAEGEQIEKIEAGLKGSKENFNNLIEIYSATSSASTSGSLSEKETRVVAQLRLKAQETNSAATALARINSENVAESLRLIILIFSIAASLFLILLIISYAVIWRSAGKLMEVDKLKDQFVSLASHELRTPMTAIRGFVTMIMEGDYGPVPNPLMEPLKDVDASTNRLIHLVNDMLDVSRIEAGRLSLVVTQFDIATVVQEVVGSLEPIAKQRQIGLSTNVSSCQVLADVDKVKEILNNLLGNSLKFTDSGAISVFAKDSGKLVEIQVTDSGAGVSLENQGKLFGKFQQMDTTQKGRPEGTGLGLYLSRELVRKMGGEMWLSHSEVGKGSTFSFTLKKC